MGSFLFFALSAKAQIQEAYFHKDTFAISETVTSIGENIFINQAKGWYFDAHLRDQYIIKLNSDLQKKDSLNVSQLIGVNNSYVLYCPKLKRIDNGRAVGIFNTQNMDYGPPRNFRQKMDVVVFDTSLHVQHLFTLDWGNSILRLLDVQYYNDSLYFVGFTTDSSFGNINNVLIKTSIDGTTRKQKLYPYSLFSTINELKLFGNIFFKNNRILISLGGDFDGGNRFAVLDHDLNLINVHFPIDSTNAFLVFPASGFFLEDGNGVVSFLSSLLSYKQPSSSHPAYPGTVPYFSMGVAQLDSSFNVIRIDSFPFSGFDYEYYINPKPYFDAFDYKVVDSVIMIMPGQEINADNFLLKDTNDIYIYNYNAVTKSMNWIKVYNSGYSNSLVSAAEVLPGNRYLIMLNEYNWDKYNYPNTSIHIMILDSKGNIVGNEEHPYLRNHLTVYPNPFGNELRVEGLPERLKPFTYKLFDMSGKELESGKLGEDGTTITTTQQTGSYILQILDEGKVYQNIPVIKK